MTDVKQPIAQESLARRGSVLIKSLRALDEMPPAIELQKLQWGHDPEAVVPAHMLFSLASYSGHILAAMDGERMVGVLIGFVGIDGEHDDRPAAENLVIASKRLIVLPEYRGRGIAYLLKLAQRDLAIKQGIPLVTWTFDPFLVVNAAFNLHKLGAISRKYRANYYGSEPGLTAFGASDRLFVEWRLQDERVKQRISGSHANLAVEQYLAKGTSIYNEAAINPNGFAVPTAKLVEPSDSPILLEIPANFGAIAKVDEPLADLWRVYLREVFSTLFDAGFAVTDFVSQEVEAHMHAFYMLEHQG